MQGKESKKQRKTKESKIVYNIKIILLGESGVGKSNLINVYIKNEFEENKLPSAYLSESFKEITIQDKSLCVSLWDTMGQEQYRSITKNFINGSNIVNFVYDITREDTILELEYWVNLTREVLNDKEVIFGVAGNKIDLLNKAKVNYEDGEAFAQKIKAVFCETSAKENKGFEKLVNSLLEKLISNENIMNKIEQTKENDDSFHIQNSKGKCC